MELSVSVPQWAAGIWLTISTVYLIMGLAASQASSPA